MLFDLTIFPEETGQIRERGAPLEPYQLFDITSFLVQTGQIRGRGDPLEPYQLFDFISFLKQTGQTPTSLRGNSPPGVRKRRANLVSRRHFIRENT